MRVRVEYALNGGPGMCWGCYASAKQREALDAQRNIFDQGESR